MIGNAVGDNPQAQVDAAIVNSIRVEVGRAIVNWRRHNPSASPKLRIYLGQREIRACLNIEMDSRHTLGFDPIRRTLYGIPIFVLTEETYIAVECDQSTAA